MQSIKQIVSMLVNESKITLFTAEGEVLDMKVDGPYDTAKISEYLSTQITGTNTVEIDLSEYFNVNKALKSDQSEGIIMTTMIGGKQVQGIFYPTEMEVTVNHEGNNVVIPNIEKLSKHINRAADTNSPAVRNFLRRLAPVVESRLHSAEDLMSFIERSELPLTDDGRIIGYKRVKASFNKQGHFTDVHSGKIDQRLGSRVWMDADKVDPSRSNSCSNGLHVANLGYLSGFSGDHTLIVLVDPADFIAVPHGETNKARVCSYDIIGIMSSYSHSIVSTGSHVEGDHTLESIISDAVQGKHVKPFEAIQVGEKEILNVKKINNSGEVIEVVYEAANRNTTSSGKSLNTDETKKKTDIIKAAKTTKTCTSVSDRWSNLEKTVRDVFDALEKETLSKTKIAEQFNTSTRTIGRWIEKYDFTGYIKFKSQPVQETEPDKPLTIPEQARAMYEANKLDNLKAFKKAKKKSWEALGFTQEEADRITI